MKSALIASVTAVVLSTGSALAAEMALPLKAPPAPAPAYTWTGCYIDAGAGYGLWNQDISSPTPLAVGETTYGGRGWLGRFGAGCDYQIAPSWVIGVLGDYDWADLHGVITPFPAVGGEEKERGAWAVGGRIGYAITPSVLTYADAGFTEARFNGVNLAPIIGGLPIGTVGALPAHDYNGWFLGGGFETSLSSFLPGLPTGLFLRTEYRYADYQSANLSYAIAGVPLVAHVQPNVQTVTTSLVWRFNWTR